VKKYQNKHWNFEITLPGGWRGPGFFGRLMGGERNPTITGPGKAELKLAIGPILPEPSVHEMQRNLQVIANRHDHPIQEIDSIDVMGKQHATMLYQVPFEFPWSLRVAHQFKNYHLVFDGIEYVVTTNIGIVPRMGLPSIAATNPVAFHQMKEQAEKAVGGAVALIKGAERFYQIYYGWGDYDDIVQTFKPNLT